MLHYIKKHKFLLFGTVLCLAASHHSTSAQAFDPYYDITVHQQMMHERIYGNRQRTVEQHHHYYQPHHYQPQPYRCPPRRWKHRHHDWSAPVFYTPPPHHQHRAHYGGWGHNNYYRQNGTTITFGFW